MGEREDFLTAVAAALPFPERLRAEVIEELAGHIEDATAALERDGVPAHEAERRVVTGFGSPAALATDLARAHQTTRRLLAAAGGGVFAGVVHGLRGTVMGVIYASVAAMTLAMLVYFAGQMSGTRLTLLTVDAGWNTVGFAAALMLGAYAAGRASVASAARLSRRGVERVRLATSLIGVAVLLALTLFWIRAPLNTASAVALLLVPFALVGGVYRPTSPVASLLRFGRMTLALIALLLVLIIGVLAQPIGGSAGGAVGAAESMGMSPDQIWTGMHFDLVGREFDDGRNPTHYASCGYSQHPDGVVHVQGEVLNQRELERWTDVRFEAWHGLGETGGVDPAYSRPFAVAEPRTVGGVLYGDVTVNRTPGVTSWWILLAGTAPDGTRYALSCPSGGNSTFNGSVWEWFTLPRGLPAA